MSFWQQMFSSFDAITISGLTNELKGIYIWQKFQTEKRSILVVENSLFEANQFYQTLLHYTDHVKFFPMDDFLTSEVLATSPELKITRLETLSSLIQNNVQIVVTNLMGFLRYLPLKEYYENSSIRLEVGAEYNIHKLMERLYQIGYTRETIVNKTGEMAVRGFVIDVFPISVSEPVRIEFWGDTIDSIRIFDIDNQRTLTSLDQVTILPNSEFLVKEEVDEVVMKQRNLPQFGEVSSIQEYLDHPTIVLDHYSNLLIGYQNLAEEMMEHTKQQELSSETTYMHSLESMFRKDQIYFEQFDENLGKDHVHFESVEIESFHSSIKEISKRLLEELYSHKTVIILFQNRYQMNKVLDEFSDLPCIFTSEEEIFQDRINLIIHPMKKGFLFGKYVVIDEGSLFGRKEHQQSYKTNFKFGTRIKDITKLQLGDYIVHSLHGIGRYCGIKTLLKNGLEKDYLQIEYKGNDKLYIPVEKMELISKYSSNDGGIPKINKLGSVEWEKTKLKARKHAENIAASLLTLYAEREARPGFAFLQDTEEQLEFENQFAYQETSDQLRVTEEIKKDMEQPHPMDRLLCGDVGYGKTEVAFRAMFKAILAGKQVALLCPTTILSNQHYQNALTRFSSFPVNIALLNRFRTAKEMKIDLKKIEEGKIDIVIGTHRLLSEDVIFKDLGLLVIDEEQRFGVKHKEKIKQYKNNIDVLTLSATPIPRTLQMSMTGLRSLSLIETPPVNRYPVQTYVLRESKEIIKDAIYKELSRDGQAFILYNYVEDMATKQREMEQLLPDARIVFAHGQMSKTELENVMQKFIDHEYDVLLCTTIIETGIDIPSVNTLIIIDADRFGLSQLYQIRGRVGRSNKIAYCYLMYHAGKVLSEIATKRLKVIKDFTELGSGFAIAMRDLSIRGAGDILGSEQAGFIDTIGIELFMKMLQEEINRLKGIPVLEEPDTDTQPLVEVETTIKDSYVEEEDLKIEIHRKISTIDSKESFENIKLELEDRFGCITPELEIYMYQEWFEKLANRLGIDKVRQTKTSIELSLNENLSNHINGEILFVSVNKISRMFRFAMKHKMLVITLDTIKLERHFIYYLIELLEVIEVSLLPK